MLPLFDWLVQQEQGRMLLSRSGQERLEQLAYSKHRAEKQRTGRAVPARQCCCPAAPAQEGARK